jgi:hypothetical protein
VFPEAHIEFSLYQGVETVVQATMLPRPLPDLQASSYAIGWLFAVVDALVMY